jgi:hypothetical protein
MEEQGGPGRQAIQLRRLEQIAPAKSARPLRLANQHLVDHTYI